MKHTNRIQRYLDGEMKGEELKKFRDDLQKDPELVHELDLHRSIGEIIVSKDEERFRKKLRNAYQEYKIQSTKQEENVDKRPAFKIWRRAAVYLPIVALTGFLIFFQLSRKESNAKIFENYFSDYQVDLNNRNNSSFREGNKTLINGLSLYQQGNYSEASRQFNLVLMDNPENLDANFYNGICFIYLNEFDDAISSFNFVISQPFSFYQEYAEWYLALSYIRTNQNEMAKATLKEIVRKDRFFSEKSKKVLRKLH